MEEINRVYSALWGEEGRCSLTLEAGEEGADLMPITASEVRARLKRLKPRGAPGPDGIKNEDVMGIGGVCGLLAGLFNLLLARRKKKTLLPEKKTLLQ